LGARGLTQPGAMTVQQNAAGSLRVSLRFFFQSPKIEDPPQEEWGIKGADETQVEVPQHWGSPCHSLAACPRENGERESRIGRTALR